MPGIDLGLYGLRYSHAKLLTDPGCPEYLLAAGSATSLRLMLRRKLIAWAAMLMAPRTVLTRSTTGAVKAAIAALIALSTRLTPMFQRLPRKLSRGLLEGPTLIRLNRSSNA